MGNKELFGSKLTNTISLVFELKLLMLSSVNRYCLEMTERLTGVVPIAYSSGLMPVSSDCVFSSLLQLMLANERARMDKIDNNFFIMNAV